MKKNKVLANIALWAGLYALWVLVFQNRALTVSRTLTVEFCYLLFIGANYYFNLLYNIPKYLYQKKYTLFGLLLLFGIGVAALLRVPLAMFLNSHFFLIDKPQPAFAQIFLNSLVNIFVWVVCLVAATIIIDKIRFQKYVEAIEKEKAKNELDFLKAQFNPHFLFNSINSIYGHIDKKNPVARKMLLTFSEMLRYQLYECNVERIDIHKEISYLKNYIALQQSRKEESLIVRLNVADDVQGFTIAPLLFIAFIENAFKYVSNSDDHDNRVEIEFGKKDDMLHFKVFNTKEKNIVTSIGHGGIGIANVRRRLELLYPDKHELLIDNRENTYTVTLNLQV